MYVPPALSGVGRCVGIHQQQPVALPFSPPGCRDGRVTFMWADETPALDTNAREAWHLRKATLRTTSERTRGSVYIVKANPRPVLGRRMKERTHHQTVPQATGCTPLTIAVKEE